MKRILFFFVHPSKYYLFRHSINALKKDGHTVDIVIVSKDVLEQLIKQEGWEYTNIFPEGRRIEGLPILMATGINFLRTLWRLQRFTAGKKYDAFITDDVLTIIGKIKGVPSLVYIDDDITAVPESGILHKFATYIIAPELTELGKYSSKKIPFLGYKELAWLAPNYFTPDKEVVKKFNPALSPYAILRLVSLTASHDAGKKGIDNIRLRQLITILETKYKVFITAERPMDAEFEPYRIKVPVQDIAHALYFAEIFIGDSQTMTSEAAVLGTPALRFNDFVGKIKVMEIKEIKYELTYGFKTDQYDAMVTKLEELMKMPRLKEIWAERRQVLLNDCEDVNEAIKNAILKTASVKEGK